MITKRRYPWLPMLLAVTMLPVPAAADVVPDVPDAEVERPRVGLVLGGGGARGAAHIGVLRELERLRVPVDAIAGTSMGAFVGGLYASGRSAAEIEELMRTIDWSDAMSDAPRREDLNFRRKQDDAQFPFKFELGVGEDGLKLPKGLVTGHRLDLLLHTLTLDVAHISDFDRLPIPFRAVASNIETAEAHVIGGGDLALAIRASMSVPGILAPTVIGEHLLVDGGLVGNLPINAIRAMDVDIIIAVDVEFPLYARDELDSAIKVSEQMLTILIRKETRRQIGTLEPQDILIRPELGTFASTDFAQIMSAVGPGTEAAVAVGDRLQRLALDAPAYAEHTARRTVPGAIEETLAFVRVIHDDGLEDRALRARVLARAGDPIDPRRFTADADRLYGLGIYEQVGYRLVEEPGGTGVEYRVRAKSWGSNTMLFGISLQDDFDGSASFNLNTRLTRVDLNSRGAEWRTDLQLGTEPLVFSEFYQPLMAGSRWFVAPRIELRRSDVQTFEMQEPLSELRISGAEAGLDFGRRLGYKGEARVGMFRGTGKSEVKVGDPGLTNTDFESGGLFAGLRMDTLDHAHFPTRGMQANLWWKGSQTGFGADTELDAYSAELSKTWTLGRSSLDLGVSYATTSDADPEPQELFSLGGFLRLSGLQRGAVSGAHTALARVVYRRRISDTAGGLLDTPVYLGASLEAGNAWQQRSDISFASALVNGSVFAGLDTLIGPVFLGAGFAEGGDSNYYLFIGAPPR